MAAWERPLMASEQGIGGVPFFPLQVSKLKPSASVWTAAATAAVAALILVTSSMYNILDEVKAEA